MASKSISLDRIILDLSVKTPYPYFEIETLMTRCRTYYYPIERAVGKCTMILETASEFGISIDESFRLQACIDYELL